jgi:filamentous hemagglutinin family protein
VTPLFSRDLAHLKASTVSRSCVSLAALLVTGAVHAQVVPSGATATSAATAANGHVSVTIAPPNSSGISANQYNNFNVGSAGVGLYNQGVNATTIINQVTSSNRSNLNGPLSVVGPAAHVIVANPNGITVNGGSFINTGGVALSTGTVSYAPSTTFPGTAIFSSRAQACPAR